MYIEDSEHELYIYICLLHAVDLSNPIHFICIARLSYWSAAQQIQNSKIKKVKVKIQYIKRI